MVVFFFFRSLAIFAFITFNYQPRFIQDLMFLIFSQKVFWFLDACSEWKFWFQVPRRVLWKYTWVIISVLVLLHSQTFLILEDWPLEVTRKYFVGRWSTSHHRLGNDDVWMKLFPQEGKFWATHNLLVWLFKNSFKRVPHMHCSVTRWELLIVLVFKTWDPSCRQHSIFLCVIAQKVVHIFSNCLW